MYINSLLLTEMEDNFNAKTEVICSGFSLHKIPNIILTKLYHINFHNSKSSMYNRGSIFVELVT